MIAASECITRSFKNPLDTYYRGTPGGDVGSLLLGTVSVVRECGRVYVQVWVEGGGGGRAVWVCSDMAGREGKGRAGWVEKGRIMYRVCGLGGCNGVGLERGQHTDSRLLSTSLTPFSFVCEGGSNGEGKASDVEEGGRSAEV